MTIAELAALGVLCLIGNCVFTCIFGALILSVLNKIEQNTDPQNYIPMVPPPHKMRKLR